VALGELHVFVGEDRSKILKYPLRRIGRITEGLLLGIAGTVDIVEPISKFTEGLQGKKGIGKMECWT
jgi:hypothetical protein